MDNIRMVKIIRDQEGEKNQRWVLKRNLLNEGKSKIKQALSPLWKHEDVQDYIYNR